jgi:ATP-dependent helicase HrpB
MAELAGEPVGRTIGYATRLDTRQSAATRILVVTEGIFVNRIQADPELPGVSAVLFDEVHERSLDSDFGSRSMRRRRSGPICGSSRCRRRSTARASAR